MTTLIRYLMNRRTFAERISATMSPLHRWAVRVSFRVIVPSVWITTVWQWTSWASY